MKLKKKYNLPLDEFINFCLYNEDHGYYMKKKKFGKDGDFITAPNISRLFSEILAIWILSFWQSIGSPKRFNLIELGGGNGEMMKILFESFQNFPVFLNSCNFCIHEKSPSLIKVQKKNLFKKRISWISKISEINKDPSIFIGNEFFDSLAIKQFKKKENSWFETFVNLKDLNKAFFFEKKIDIKKIEKKIDFKISKNQNFIEYSELGFNYLKKISKIIKKNKGGLLLIDYGNIDKKMKNSLRAFSKHKFANILDDIGNVDITHSINFELFQNYIKHLGELKYKTTSQKNFLTQMGIKHRAEIISRNQIFSKKAEIYYRMKKLIDDNQMGSLFKVMLIKNKENKFSLGF